MSSETASADPTKPTARSSASSETLEDYTLRYSPHSYRRWTPTVVASTALGGMAYLADFSIGAGIGLDHGTINALLGILVAVVIIFCSALPIGYYGARYNIDIDLITRGAGFGYYGSILTAVIFGSFTFIFFAIEGSIMAQGLDAGLGIPLWLGYLICSLIIIPLVVYGMKALSKLQLWTTPIWVVLLIGPIIYLAASKPDSLARWWGNAGGLGEPRVSGSAIMLSAGVVLSLIVQIGEQVDYMRFMPRRTSQNRRSWWIGMILGGPGWVFFAAIKLTMALFLSVYALSYVGPTVAQEPVQQFMLAFREAVPGWLAITLAAILVVLSQVKINVTNAYSGSCTWTNVTTRITRRYPGRIVFVLGNVAVALTLMEANMFAVLNGVLTIYSDCAIAWIITVATDIGINKYLLGLSPKMPEYRRGMLYAVNPVGAVSFAVSTLMTFLAYFGVLGATLADYSPMVAIVCALVLTPAMAILTRGRFYLRRNNDGIAQPRFEEDGTPSGKTYTCCVCEQEYERPDVLASATGAGSICSLCLATDTRGEHVLPATG